MKMKKVLASVAAVAMAASMVSALSASASAVTAGATTIDFEDGDFSFVYLNLDDGSDASVLSVEDYDGSKQLKVDVQQTGKVPKVWFDLDKMTDRANTIQISTIELDMTFVPKSETETVGWAGGVLCSAGGFDQANTQSSQVNPGWNQTDWACEDENAYTEGAAAKVHATKKFLLPSSKYTEESVNPFFGIMRWASDYNYVMYVDNIVLKDSKGNALPVGVTVAEETTAAEGETVVETEAAPEAAPAETEAATEAAVVETEAAPAETEAVAETEAAVVETEAAPAETEAAPVVTEAAPVADTTTPVANTGNTAVAAIAAVMALAGAVAVASKRK